MNHEPSFPDRLDAFQKRISRHLCEAREAAVIRLIHRLFGRHILLTPENIWLTLRSADIEIITAYRSFAPGEFIAHRGYLQEGMNRTLDCIIDREPIPSLISPPAPASAAWHPACAG